MEELLSVNRLSRHNEDLQMAALRLVVANLEGRNNHFEHGALCSLLISYG